MGSAKVTGRLAWLTKRDDYGRHGVQSVVRTVGRKPGVSALGCAWLAAAGTWTRIRVRGCSPMGREDASVRLGVVASGGRMLRNVVSMCPAPLELLAGSSASPTTFRAGALDSECRAPEGTARSWRCSGAPRVYLGAAPPAWPEGRVRGVPRAWLCLPGGDQARAGCASFQGFLALPSVRACWRTRRGSAFPSPRALSVPRLHPQSPRRGPAGQKRASGECGETLTQVR